MELSWSTFALEIINFVVLIWILKRFLYHPVLEVIERRRKGIETQLNHVDQQRREAESRMNDYEHRLAEWHQERQQRRVELQQELDAERSRQMEALQASLRETRNKAEVAEAKQQATMLRKLERQALRQGAEFATRLIALTTGPELETRLVELAIESLSTLPEEQAQAIRSQWGKPPEKAQILTVHPLPATQKKRLEQALANLIGTPTPITYAEDPSLLAGVLVSIDAWSLAANLRDDLKSFAEFSHVN